MFRRWRRLSVSLLLICLCAAPLGAQQFGEIQARPFSTRSHYGRIRPFAFEFLGTPGNSKTIGVFKNTGPAINFPASLTAIQQGPIIYSSGATCGTSPSNSSAYLLKVNGTTQCTLTLSTASPCVLTVTTCTTPWTLANGQTLTLVAPGTVNGEADLGFTIMGYYQ